MGREIRTTDVLARDAAEVIFPLLDWLVEERKEHGDDYVIDAIADEIEAKARPAAMLDTLSSLVDEMNRMHRWMLDALNSGQDEEVKDALRKLPTQNFELLKAQAMVKGMKG